MKTKLRCRRPDGSDAFPKLAIFGLIAAFANLVELRAAQFSEWQYRQSVDVTSSGLVKIILPPTTLDALRPGLEDFRIADPNGAEVPFLLQRPSPVPPSIHPVKSFEPTLQPETSTLVVETGFNASINAITLETPGQNFIKALRVEGAQDGRNYTLLSDGAILFRQPGASELTVRLPEGVWPWLRLTIDNRRSPPLPFTGARIHAALGSQPPTESAPLIIKGREEDGTVSRLSIDLGGANQTFAALEFESPDVLFQREVALRIPVINGDEAVETGIARGTIYAIDTGTGVPVRRLVLPVEQQIYSREMIVIILNYDSPPLRITGLRATRRPVNAIFRAAQPGSYVLYAGNSQCPAPRYDLASLGEQLKDTSAPLAVPGPLTLNPEFRPTDRWAGLAESGAALDVAPWRFRKSVLIAAAGPQQLELDPDVLAHARNDLGDVRLLRDGKQVPYLLQRTSLMRTLTPNVAVENDPKQPRFSRWRLTLSHPNLPIVRIECRARTALFQRAIRVWEEVPDGRGGKIPRDLGFVEWRRDMDTTDRPLTIPLDARLQTDTIFLDTDNRENTPIELDQFQALYRVSRLLFKTATAPVLYYGNPSAVAPRYDLSLVAGKLLAAAKAQATASPEESLKATPWNERPALTGVNGWIFWSVLVLVVAGLLFVIARLLPKPPATGEPPASRG